MFAPAGVCDISARPFRAMRQRKIAQAAAGSPQGRVQPRPVALEPKP
jgi:hypothetical protein